MQKFRLYIDEVGNSDLRASEDPNHRYLGLTGVILDLDYVAEVVFPRLELLKHQYFASHPDDPVILHRKELVNAKPPFTCLRDQQVKACFNADLLTLLRDIDFTVITAVIDKLEHRQRYTMWREDPYHYCLTVILERYGRWLERNTAMGDVMAESRGGNDDRRLKRVFEEIYREGTDYLAPTLFQQHFTSCQLKVKPKANNIAGLQIADLVAHPSCRACICAHTGLSMPTTFGNEIEQIMTVAKYFRSASGHIEGWGRMWLP